MDEKQTVLQLDISLELKGYDVATLNHQAAKILRKIANQVENDEFKYGHHQIGAAADESAGSLYIDFTGDRGRNCVDVDGSHSDEALDADASCRRTEKVPTLKEGLVRP